VLDRQTFVRFGGEVPISLRAVCYLHPIFPRLLKNTLRDITSWAKSLQFAAKPDLPTEESPLDTFR
jgi:hypothetical protein